jgi:hypothetical protein
VSRSLPAVASHAIGYAEPTNNLDTASTRKGSAPVEESRAEQERGGWATSHGSGAGVGDDGSVTADRDRLRATFESAAWLYHHVSYSTGGYIRLLDTFSGHIAMDAWKRDRLYSEIRRRVAERPDGRLRRHWGTVLHVARRRAVDVSSRCPAPMLSASANL